MDIKKIREDIKIVIEDGYYVASHPIHPTLNVCAPTLEEAEMELLQYVMYLVLLNKKQ